MHALKDHVLSADLFVTPDVASQTRETLTRILGSYPIHYFAISKISYCCIRWS